jgi:phosphatidylglycerol---prolipoprotein diacylglyceryl transferase
MMKPSAAATRVTRSDRSGAWGALRDAHNRTVLFRVGSWVFVTYGLLAGAAFFAGFSTGIWYDALLGSPVREHARFYVFFMLPFVLLGARLFSIVLEFRERAPLELFKHPIATLLKPGYVLHGGVFGGALADVIFSYVAHVPLLRLLDVCAFALPLGEAICRLGCYVYGCCWGRPSESGVGVCYTSPHAKVVRCAPELRGVALHPTQLYSALAHGVQFVLFLALLPHVAFDGFYAVLYLFTHPILRFSLERLRFDDRGKALGGLTQTQVYSLIQVALGGAILVWVTRTGMHHPPALDLGVGWLSVATSSGVAPLLLITTAIATAAFGVHFRSVGAWVGAPTADRVAER